jgi:hypothetical protein
MEDATGRPTTGQQNVTRDQCAEMINTALKKQELSNQRQGKPQRRHSSELPARGRDATELPQKADKKIENRATGTSSTTGTTGMAPAMLPESSDEEGMPIITAATPRGKSGRPIWPRHVPKVYPACLIDFSSEEDCSPYPEMHMEPVQESIDFPPGPERHREEDMHTHDHTGYDPTEEENTVWEKMNVHKKEKGKGLQEEEAQTRKQQKLEDTVEQINMVVNATQNQVAQLQTDQTQQAIQNQRAEERRNLQWDLMMHVITQPGRAGATAPSSSSSSTAQGAQTSEE